MSARARACVSIGIARQKSRRSHLLTVIRALLRYTNNMDVARLLIRAGANPAAANSRGIAAKDMVQRW
eukprot:COSAG03_NODE_832_length_5683_cov_10.516112_2_plen_68_part_00